MVEVVEAARAGAAVDGVGGGPAEEVQTLGVLKGQDALVLEEHEALLRDLCGDSLRLLGKVLGDRGGRCAAADQAQQGGHGAEANEICHDQDREQRREPALTADEFLPGLGQLFHRDGHGDGGHKGHGNGDKVGNEPLQYADQVFHFKRDHGFAPLSYVFPGRLTLYRQDIKRQRSIAMTVL